jgi:hypothetical protein
LKIFPSLRFAFFFSVFWPGCLFLLSILVINRLFVKTMTSKAIRIRKNERCGSALVPCWHCNSRLIICSLFNILVNIFTWYHVKC